jgi:hypothetical protein
MPAYNFNPQFAGAIERREKRQTIRARGKRRPPRIGETLFLYTGMRTSACRRLLTSPCTGVELIQIDAKRREVSMPRPFGAGQAWTRLEDDEVELLARDDGFASADAFFAWFDAVHGRSMSGYLIRWE